jgi:hypothetical protein
MTIPRCAGTVGKRAALGPSHMNGQAGRRERHKPIIDNDSEYKRY